MFREESPRQAAKVVCLPGDGIGPEVVESAVAILKWAAGVYGLKIELSSCPFGGASVDLFGSPLTDETLAQCRAADAVLLGAVGGPKWDSCAQNVRPETGLLRIRNELGLFCNLRPAKVYPALVESSSLRSDVILGTDIVVVRELTGGLYFGQPRGADSKEAWNTARYSCEEVDRIAHAAFQLALQRKSRITSVDKANVLEVSQFWRTRVKEIHKQYPDVELSHLYIDNAAMQLVRSPRSFDVILTSNLFGDILSDLAGMLTGSLGMLPSASLGVRHALYEPIHGSAPDIAGKGIANPLGTIGSVALFFEYTMGRKDIALAIEKGIHRTFERRVRTADISTHGTLTVGTQEMTRQLLQSLEELQGEIADTPQQKGGSGRESSSVGSHI